jgi:hypothetical protein
VKNHSVPEKVVSDVFEQSHDFFSLPSETKKTVRLRLHCCKRALLSCLMSRWTSPNLEATSEVTWLFCPKTTIRELSKFQLRGWSKLLVSVSV